MFRENQAESHRDSQRFAEILYKSTEKQFPSERFL